ncbi:MAG: glycosyltransferase family 4 protein [Muribaculaceae bacterium]|nr:glycosyltransferase family 4 protein [Muribaculaceae bacterium]
MKVFFATRARGFFRHLFQAQGINAQFIYDNSSIYENNPKIRKLLGKILRWRIFDWFGIIQIIKCKKTGCEIHGSFNRFLDSDKPYFMYVETPSAPYNYCLGRNKTIFGSRVISRNLENPNLKAIVFMVDVCQKTFESQCGPIAPHCRTERIYPLIPQNRHVSEQQIRAKKSRSEVKLLFISQGPYFLAKGALEIVEAYKRLHSDGLNCSLTMVTNLSEIRADILQPIQSITGITLYDFAFTYEQMEKLYADHDILLHPTSADSCPLTVFEALHAGLPIIASRLFAIPEVVKDGINGYLVDPAYWYYDRNNLPNLDIWRFPEKTIFSEQRSESVTVAIYERLKYLLEHRDVLEQMALSSYEMANSAPFSKEHIVGQWNELLANIQ